MTFQYQQGSGLAPDVSASEQALWLLGQPSLRQYLDFVKDMVVGGEGADPATLNDEWRTANEYYQELEDRECGIADRVESRDLAPSLSPLAAEVRSDPRFRRTFDIVPASFGIVELDRLVVAQKQIILDLTDSLAARLGPAPDAATLFHFCLPLGQPDTPVQIYREGSRRFVFRSSSHDVRFHELVTLRPEQVRGYETFGPLVGLAGAVIGFGSNFLNVISVGKRLLLHDGYHRAYALRQLGVTHAPCIIQQVTHAEEIDLVAKQRVAEDPEFFFDSARPPLLKDYFDPRLRKLVQVHKVVKRIEVSIEVRDNLVPE